MRKQLVQATLLGSLLLLAACSDMMSKSSPAPASAAPAMSASSSAGSAIARILQTRTLTVGMTGDQAPLNMTNKQGTLFGFEIDLANSMASAMGVQLKTVTMPFADLLAAVETGKVDMVLSGVTITPARNLKVAFVGPYFVDGASVLMKEDRAKKLKGPKTIKDVGKTLAAMRGTTSEQYVKTTAPDAKLVLTTNYDEGVQLVSEGKVDAFVADYTICATSVLRYPDRKLTTLEAPFTFEPIGIVLPPNDPLLVNWADNFLDGYQASGALDILTAHWFADGWWLADLK